MTLRSGMISDYERYFWSVVLVGDDCWTWLGAKKKAENRGITRWKGKVVAAARASWMLYYQKEVPEGLYILHTCDNPICVRPTHLYPGTHQENMIDSVTRKRHKESRKTSCIYGHEFSKENTFIHKDKRSCRICRRSAMKKYRLNKKKQLGI